MQEFFDQVEKDLPTRLPQFKTKEEIMVHARERYFAKRGVRTGVGGTGAPNVHEGTSNTDQFAGAAIQRNQGYSGSYAEYSDRVGQQGGTQAYAVHAGDGRNAPGTGGTYGYSNVATVGDREYADSGIGADQYNGSASGISKPEVYAPPPRRGFRSKVKSFADTAFGPIPGKEQSETKKQPVVSASKVLSAAEANDMRPRLIEYLTWQSDHMDQFIIATTRGHDPTIVIWSNLDDAEIEIIADYLLNRARKDKMTAQAVRYAVTLLERIKVGIIVLPRLYRTMLTYLQRGLDIPIFVR